MPLLALLISTSAFAASSTLDEQKTIAKNLTEEVLLNGQDYSNLRELTAKGPRLSGSKGAAQAIEWAKHKMSTYGFDRVYLQPTKVPKWERGSIEKLAIVGKSPFHATALGQSTSTPKGGVTAEVIEVQSLQEMEALGDKLKGKFIFFNRPMDPLKVRTFDAYGGASDQRFLGPGKAAKLGAVGAIVRSMTLSHDNVPHTGTTKFAVGDPTIPAFAIATNDADLLSRELLLKPTLKVHMESSAKNFGMVDSFNVIGEIKGSEIPNEFVVIGGHLDSWDLSAGATDDGAGSVQAVEALRAIHALGLKPRRTIRAVLFMAEEQGSYGGDEYAKQAKLNNEKHIAAIEADNGSASPVGFGIDTKDTSVFEKAKAWSTLLEPLYASDFHKGYGGSDIEALGETQATPQFGLNVDSQRYFDVHHSKLDTFDRINARELHLGSAAMAILGLTLANQ